MWFTQNVSVQKGKTECAISSTAYRFPLSSHPYSFQPLGPLETFLRWKSVAPMTILKIKTNCEKGLKLPPTRQVLEENLTLIRNVDFYQNQPTV